MLAGMLPQASRITMRQSMVRGEAMHQAAAGLGGRGIEQVGADRGRRVNAEQQDQQRRHQRAAADAGHADQEADAETRSNVERIDHWQASAR